MALDLYMQIALDSSSSLFDIIDIDARHIVLTEEDYLEIREAIAHI